MVFKSQKGGVGASTFATALGGYSTLSLVSTHCLTLSSLSFGVA